MFSSSIEAIGSIKPEKGIVEFSARRALVAKDWLTSYYGRSLRTMPEDERTQFIAAIEPIVERLARYADSYPLEGWPEPEPKGTEEEMSVIYHELKQIADQFSSLYA
jgi:hypothetical protein